MTITIAAIGCSGPVAATYIQGFLDLEVHIKLLTRSAEKKFPEGVQLVVGSMMNPTDVAKAMEQVDAAFLVTPMATQNQTESEIEAAKAVLEGAKQANLKHLVYTSVLGSDAQRGVGILDAKYEIEKLIKESGIPHTILRCGTYMEDVFDPRIQLLNKGIYLFPIQKEAKITYTCQADVPRFVVKELLSTSKGALNKPINFVRQDNQFSVQQVESLLSETSGITIRTVPRFPAFYLFKAALPVFNWKEHRFSSVIPLMDYFDQHGYTVGGEEDTGVLVETEFPNFQLSTLKDHLEKLWPKEAK